MSKRTPGGLGAIINERISVELSNEIDRLAVKYNKTRAEFVRMALGKVVTVLQQHEQTTQQPKGE